MDTSTYAFHTKQPKWIYLQITGYISTDAFHTKPTKKSTQKTSLAIFHTHPKHKIHALLLIAVFSVFFYMMYTSFSPTTMDITWFVCEVLIPIGVWLWWILSISLYYKKCIDVKIVHGISNDCISTKKFYSLILWMKECSFVPHVSFPFPLISLENAWSFT